MKIHRSVVVAAAIVGCNDSGSGPNPDGSLIVGFDVTGVSNSTCTLLVQNADLDAASAQTQFAIGAPSPPLQNTTLAPSRSPAKTCNGVTNANPVTVSGPPNVNVTVTRSDTGMCVKTDDLRTAVGYPAGSSPCPVTLTLTCEGVVMYDHIQWSIAN